MNPSVTENVVHIHRRKEKKKDTFAFENNPSIDLLIFISAFLKLLPFLKHFIQLNMRKINMTSFSRSTWWVSVLSVRM